MEKTKKQLLTITGTLLSFAIIAFAYSIYIREFNWSDLSMLGLCFMGIVGFYNIKTGNIEEIMGKKGGRKFKGKIIATGIILLATMLMISLIYF